MVAASLHQVKDSASTHTDGEGGCSGYAAARGGFKTPP